LSDSSAPQKPEGIFQGRLLKLGELRDATLFLSTAAYVLGYGTWAVYSSSRGLGVLPPLEGQYFLAGVIPLALLIAATVAIRGSAPSPDERVRRRLRSWVKRLGPLVVALGVASFIRWDAPEGLLMFALAIAALYATLVLEVRSGETTSRLLNSILRLVVPAFVIFLTESVYALVVFPVLPLELGGPSPACVRLDLKGATLNRETASFLSIPAEAT
jgi:hypothetical protein